MAKPVKRKCPGCGETKEYRSDQKTCGCNKNPQTEQPVLTEKNEITQDTWTITLPKTRIHTLEQLLEFCKVDLTVWEVERFVVNKWEVGMKPPATTEYMETEDGRRIPAWVRFDAEPIIEPLYQVKAFLRRKKAIVFALKEIQDLKELSKTGISAPKNTFKKPKTQPVMLEINLTDHHFGKLAWGLETGQANYDVKIATQVFHRALDTILSRAPFSSYEEIWFVVGNDLFNADDTQGRTTSGTQVESDVRHEKTYVTVRTLMVQAIEKLRPLAGKVRVIVVPGNHDHNATWHLGDSLELYFSKHEDVTVDNRPCSRKYHQFGQTLIGYAHGDKGKLKDLPMLMATEARELFGATKFHEIHTGHIHTLKVDEKHGVRVRILSALCPPDAWHSENGYVGNLRSSEAFVWDKEQGLIGIVIYTDDDALIEKASNKPASV
jgi:hypothetical protein